MKTIKGLEDIFTNYDGFILDLWGVVHDGVKPLPGAVEAMTLLKKARRKIWLLSNAPRRAHVVVQRLTEMGVAPELYDGVLTSGEASWQSMREGKWGKSCFHIGALVRDGSLFEDLDIELVRDPADADFVLASGVDDFSDPAEKYLPALQACAAAELPMLCANPDRVVHVEDNLVICAGTLADMYETLDGKVTFFGKPYRSVYSAVLKEMGPRERVLAVGDSMLTDIAGATGAGIDSLLVTSGLHREEFSEGFLEKYPYKPTYVAKRFAW